MDMTAPPDPVALARLRADFIGRAAPGCGGPATDLKIRLAPVLVAPREAREFVRHHLPKLGLPTLIDSATVVATELITNSVKYAPGGPVGLSLRLIGGRPLIEVQDCSPELPVFKEPDYIAESGRGLHVVRAHCAILDWTQIGTGKLIWALLETE